MIIQTIRRDPSRSIWTDGPSNVSRLDPSGADQIDAEHQPTDLAVGGSNPSRPARSQGQQPEGCLLVTPVAMSVGCPATADGKRR
jgi:hypothetical protein